ncbi:hypothetical protein [Bacteroides reticulotermitis]|uniref:Uncharacterized protein n=2 Tax=Bacteroides reticulotermitis TaxID=1133319 RepID=W4UUR2_9BACE|nr:hypothetical protein [Bacteroides reticulotermitis]MBB4045262.1 hypothetical protein [Bacteroides reticulotermitis]GAE84259.1 hypothetical protein JCM10512_2592 [Bacteroides reticulotermitis JCM 10512]
MKIIIGAVGVTCLLIIVYAFRLKEASDLATALERLKIRFRETQAYSEKVQEDLEDFMEINDAYEYEVYPDVKCKNLLEELKILYSGNLSDTVFNMIDILDLPHDDILAMTKSLEKQLQAFTQLSNLLQTITIKEKGILGG